MKHSADEILGIVYKFYPRGIQTSYDDTEEALRLDEARRQAAGNLKPWREMLRRLAEHFPERPIVDGTEAIVFEASDEVAYRAWFEMEERSTEHAQGATPANTIACLVSFLIPYYVIFSTRTRLVEDPDEKAAFLARRARQRPRRHEARAKKRLEEALNRGAVYQTAGWPAERPITTRDVTLELSREEQPYAAAMAREIDTTYGYEPMPPEIGNLIVSDVETASRNFGEATIYACLMSDQW